MDKRDYITYMEFYKTIKEDLQPPSVMIFLRCSIKTMRKRILMRGREMERNISTSYLRRLDSLYFEWISRYNLSPVIEINSDKMDYVSDLLYRYDLLKTIEKFL